VPGFGAVKILFGGLERTRLWTGIPC
jgi:hypothetical protein